VYQNVKWNAYRCSLIKVEVELNSLKSHIHFVLSLLSANLLLLGGYSVAKRDLLSEGVQHLLPGACLHDIFHRRSTAGITGSKATVTLFRTPVCQIYPGSSLQYSSEIPNLDMGDGKAVR
jgi:hypothetical protein